MRNIPEQIFAPIMPDTEAIKREYCACTSCKNNGICKYYSKFIDYQQTHFPAKIECWKYEKELKNENCT